MAMTLQQRRFHGRVNGALVGLCASVCFVLLALLVDGVSAQVDISADGWSTVEPETDAVMAELEASGVAVQIIGFSHQVRFRERDRAMSTLLRALDARSARVRSEFIRMDADRMRALEFGVERHGTVVLRGNGRRVDLDPSELTSSEGDFIGEGPIRRAIRRLIAPTLPIIQVIQAGPGAFHGVDAIIDDLGYDVERLDSRTIGLDYAGADLLIVFADGPFDEGALQRAVRTQLGVGGSLLFAAEPGSDAWDLVQSLGVTSPPGVVYDAQYVVPYPRQPHLEVLPHGSTVGLAVGQHSPRVSSAGAVTVRTIAGPVWQEVLRTSRMGWLETEPGVVGVPTREEPQSGPFTVAAALTRRDQVNRRDSRAMVVADIDLFEDGFVATTTSNQQFIRNAIRWLTGRSSVSSRHARPRRSVVMSESELRVVQVGLLVPYPLCWLSIGMVIRRLRRRA